MNKSQDLQDYLNSFYIKKQKLADILSFSPSAIDELIIKGYLPSWSYRIEGKHAYTHVFGKSSSLGAEEGEYFSPYVIDWFRKFTKTFPLNSYRLDTYAAIRDEFVRSYILTARVYKPFVDVFPSTETNDELLRTMAVNTWEQHMKGTYGVSVQEPASILRIIEKQSAAQALTILTENGKKSNYSIHEIMVLNRRVYEYNRVAMPFSPVDYDKSSRKRLVDDVLKKIH